MAVDEEGLPSDSLPDTNQGTKPVNHKTQGRNELWRLETDAGATDPETEQGLEVDARRNADDASWQQQTSKAPKGQRRGGTNRGDAGRLSMGENLRRVQRQRERQTDRNPTTASIMAMGVQTLSASTNLRARAVGFDWLAR